MSELTASLTRARRAGLLGPVIALLAFLWLLYHLLTSELYSFAGARTGYGPLSWPEAALVLLILATAWLCAARAWALFRTPAIPDNGEETEEEFDNRMVIVGGLMILVYGLGMVFLGFLLSSIVFLALWLLYGGMRNPLTIALLSILGTLGPLYLLVKVAYMPLPRGIGIIETATVRIYEWLGVF